MEVESDEEDEKQEKTDEPSTQLDQDTQVQDMDEVGSQQKWHYSCPVRFVWDLLWSSLQYVSQYIEGMRFPFF